MKSAKLTMKIINPPRPPLASFSCWRQAKGGDLMLKILSRCGGTNFSICNDVFVGRENLS